MPLRPDIAIFGMNYPPEPTGIAPYTSGLAAGLHKRGYEVTAHVAQPHYPQWTIYKGYEQWARAESLDGVGVRRRWHYVPHSPHGIRRLLSELSFGTRLVFAHWESCRAVIVVSPALFSSMMVALRMRFTPRRPPLVIWVQDFYALGMAETGEGVKLAGRLTRWVEAHTLRAADCVVVIHPRFARYAVEELGVKASNVVVVRNWAHLLAAAPVDSTAAKLAMGWPTDMTLAVHTGNMGVKQGLENVVEAARVADDVGAPVHFILVGDGCERHKLMVRGRGISRLTFVDPLCDADYRLALSASDVLLVNEKPGVATMAVPSKLTSYFHAGRPVIAATDPKGISAEELVASGAGTVIPAGEPRTLLDAVVSVSADPEAAARFGLSGQRYREAVLDESVAIEQWAILIEDVLANGYQQHPRSSVAIRATQPSVLGTTPPCVQRPPAS
jgi:glycosyltransferase involved in cell wall biosynthesis